MKDLPILVSLFAIAGWNQRSLASDNQTHSMSQHDNIIIDNLSGNFGEILIEKGFTRTFQLKNNYSKSINILSLTIINDNHNSFALNENKQELYCKNQVNSEEYCNIPMFFKPKSIDYETAQLIIKYSIDSSEKTYVFDLSGWGRESTETLKLLSRLGRDFLEIKLDENILLDEHFTEDIIPSTFASNHSQTYNYYDHSFQKPKFIDSKRNKPDDYSRSNGYTFRVEERAPHVSYENDLCGKYSKKEDKIDCGIEDLGGFWSYGTMNVNSTVEKIEVMLNKYRILNNNNDYDIEKISFIERSQGDIPALKDLTIDDIEKMNIDSLKDHLYYYLKDQLNLDKHIHDDYSYTGFVSTTSSPIFLLGYHESANRNWFYAMYVEGAIKYYGFNESEFAVPGGIDWDDVMGYFNKENGKAYIRQGFESLDNEAYNKIKHVFSILNYEFSKPNDKK